MESDLFTYLVVSVHLTTPNNSRIPMITDSTKSNMQLRLLTPPISILQPHQIE